MSTADWGAATLDTGPRAKRWQFVAAPVGVAFLIALVMGSVFLGTWGIVIGAAFVGGVIGWVLDAPRRCLASVGATPLDAARYPRPSNIVDGLAARLGIPAPELYVLAAPGPNALTSSRHGGAIALTQSLLDGYSRTELEAVLAHCLVRLRRGAVQRATTRLALGPTGRLLIEPVGTPDDVAAAAVTRYPPALAAAISKAEPRGGKYAPLWFVPAGRPALDPASRVEALSDL